MPTTKPSKTKRTGKKKKKTTLTSLKKAVVKLQKAPELKFTDVDEITTVSSTGEVWWISGTTQGTTQITHIGRRICLHSILIRRRAFLYPAVVTQENYTAIRFIVFIDNLEAKSALPTITDVLSGSNVLSPLNKSNATRFRVLYDELITLSIYGPGTQSGYFYKRFPPGTKYAEFQANTGAATDAGKGHIYVLQLSDSTAVDHPSSDFYSRVQYCDE